MDIQTSLKNMCMCRRGEHPLYRGYGLNGVDGSGLRKAEIKQQLDAFYPEIRNVEIKNNNTLDDISSGHFKYEISVSGYEQF